MKYPWLSHSTIEIAAARLLSRAFGTGCEPTSRVDLDAIVFDCLAEQDGLVFDDDAALGTEDGDVVLGKTLPLAKKILINQVLKSPTEFGRKRFTIAHELGHWVLHRPLFLAEHEHLSLFDDQSGPTVALVSLNRSLFGPSEKAVSTEEWQANRFAVELLSDGRLLRDAFIERFGEPPAVRQTTKWSNRAASLRHLSRHLARKGVPTMLALHEVFGLSVEAMAVGLESRGYVTETKPLL